MSMSMSMSTTISSHQALPPVLPAPAAQPVRLPSYKELAALSQCDAHADGHGAGPAPSRSSLFTKGLIHLPPLKVPSQPLTAKDERRDRDRDRLLDLARHCPMPPRASPPAMSASTSPAHARDDKACGAARTSPHHPPPPQSWPASASAPAPALLTHAGYPPLPPHPAPHGHAHAHAHAHTHTHGQTHSNPPYSPLAAYHPTSASTSSASPPPADALAAAAAAGQKLKFSHAKAGGRTKKQALSCFFCRERKIACGRPDEGSPDGRCNQCARRKIECTYPTVSHRGQHSRLKSAARKGLTATLPNRSPPPPAHAHAQGQGQGQGAIALMHPHAHPDAIPALAHAHALTAALVAAERERER